MAKTVETFRKRQRERQVREKAELKRMQREQRRAEKKLSQPDPAPLAATPPPSEEFPAAGRNPGDDTPSPERN